MISGPFKQRSHYVFDYKPRYYDERKERLENLKEKYRPTKKNKTDEDYKVTLVKNNLKNDWARTKSNASADTSANRRLAIIIAVLVGICAYIFELHTLI